MTRLSAVTAVGLADLVLFCVGDGVKLSDLAGFGVLRVVLRDTGTKVYGG